MLLLPIIIHTLLSTASSTDVSTQCAKWIQSLIDSQFLTLPNYTVLYSGLAVNNPGQKQECERSNFSYFLVYTDPPAPNLTSFTGFCLPPICDADDVQAEVSNYAVTTTFGFDGQALNWLAWVGLVLFFIYAAVLVAAMTVNSFKDEKEQATPAEGKIDTNTSINEKDSLLESLAYGNTKPILQDRGFILKVFNCYNHYCKIFAPQQHKNVLSGLRVMSVFMIIVATEFSFRQNLAQNDVDAATVLNGGVGYIITNVQFAYTVWLFAAGVAAAYALYKVDSFKDMFKGILAKLMRVWPYLLLFTLFVYGITEALVADPLVKVWEMKYTNDCPATFWRKWFLINPLIEDNTVCMPWTWLIESELLLYLLAPVFIVIAKSRKWLGYVLLAVMTLISILFSVFLLDHKDISFFPAVLFNNSDEYVLQFQMNALVQSAPFAIGMLFGVLFVNALDKMEGENTVEIRLGNLVKKGGAVTLLMQLIGLVLMNVAFWLIVPTIDNPKSSFTRFFLSTTPTMFALGLGLLITPSVLGGSSRLTNFLNSFLGGSFWQPLDRMALTIYLIAPVVIGAMTFSLQTSLYYSYEGVFLLLIGDTTLILVLSLLLTSTLEMTCAEAQKEIEYKAFGMINRESVVGVED